MVIELAHMVMMNGVDVVFMVIFVEVIIVFIDVTPFLGP